MDTKRDTKLDTRVGRVKAVAGLVVAGSGCMLMDLAAIVAGYVLPHVAVESFEQVGLRPSLLRAVSVLNMDRMAPIHKESLIPLVDGHTIILSGHTRNEDLAIACLHHADASDHRAQCLVIGPIWEYVMGLRFSIIKMSRNMADENGERIGVLSTGEFGQNDMKAMMQAMRHGQHQVVIGTPMRLWDLIRRRLLDITALKFVAVVSTEGFIHQGNQDVLFEIFRAIQSASSAAQFCFAFQNVPADFPTNWLPTQPLLIGPSSN